MRCLAAGGQVHQLQIYSNLNLDCVDRVFVLSDDADLLSILERASSFISVHGWCNTRFLRDAGRWYFDTDAVEAAPIRFLNHDSFDGLRFDLLSHARAMNIEAGGLVYISAGRIDGRHKYVSFLVHHLIVDAITMGDLVHYCITSASKYHLEEFTSAPSFADYSRHLHSLYSHDASDTAFAAIATACRPGCGLHIGNGRKPSADPVVFFRQYSFRIETSHADFDAFCSGLNLWPREALTSLFLLGLARCIGTGRLLLGMCTPGREDADGRAIFQRTLGFLAVPTPLIIRLPDSRSTSGFLDEVADQWTDSTEYQHLWSALSFSQKTDRDSIDIGDSKIIMPEIVFNYYGELNEFKDSTIRHRIELGSFSSFDNRKRNDLQVGMFRTDAGFLFDLLFNATSISPATIDMISARVKDAASETLQG